MTAPPTDPAMSGEPAAPDVQRFAGGDVDSVHAELVALYAQCYAGPPWHEGPDEVDAYAERIRTWAAHDGFTGLLARDRDGTLLAAAYGWTGPPEIRGLPMPGIEAALVFHVGDLMVHPRAQRRGLGRTLLNRLVSGRRPAVLVTHADSGARRLYESAGWRRAGTLSPPGSWEMVVYALDTGTTTDARPR